MASDLQPADGGMGSCGLIFTGIGLLFFFYSDLLSVEQLVTLDNAVQRDQLEERRLYH